MVNEPLAVGEHVYTVTEDGWLRDLTIVALLAGREYRAAGVTELNQPREYIIHTDQFFTTEAAAWQDFLEQLYTRLPVALAGLRQGQAFLRLFGKQTQLAGRRLIELTTAAAPSLPLPGVQSAAMCRVAELEAAIRKHRDFLGDNRCHMDDHELYLVLPEGDTRPEKDTAVTIENCEKFIACRHDPGRTYVSPQVRIEELEADNTKLAAFKAWVHNRLDELGVPADPDPENTARDGCRISGRIDWLWRKVTSET